MPTDPDQQPPDVYIRCLRCNEVVEADWFDVHMAEDCDGVEWEEL